MCLENLILKADFVKRSWFCEIKLTSPISDTDSILRPNTNECFKLFYELMNPTSVVDTKLVCKFINKD